MNFDNPDPVTVIQGKYKGNNGIVACRYPDDSIDVDMLDGSDQGWIVRFQPEQLRRR